MEPTYRINMCSPKLGGTEVCDLWLRKLKQPLKPPAMAGQWCTNRESQVEMSVCHHFNRPRLQKATYQGKGFFDKVLWGVSNCGRTGSRQLKPRHCFCRGSCSYLPQQRSLQKTHKACNSESSSVSARPTRHKAILRQDQPSKSHPHTFSLSYFLEW